MLAVLFWCLIIGLMVKTAATDVIYALQGQKPPRHERRMARIKEGKSPQRYGVRGWWDDLLEDALRSNTSARRGRAAEKQAARLGVPLDDMADVAGVRAGKDTPAPVGKVDRTPDAPTIETVPDAPDLVVPCTSPDCDPCRQGDPRCTKRECAPAQGAPQDGTGGPEKPAEVLAVNGTQPAGDARPPLRLVPPIAQAPTGPAADPDDDDPQWAPNTNQRYDLTQELFGHGPVCGRCRQAIDFNEKANRFECLCTDRRGSATDETLKPANGAAAPAVAQTTTEGNTTVNAETTHILATRRYFTELDEHVKAQILPGLEQCAALLSGKQVDPEVIGKVHNARSRFTEALAALGDALATHDEKNRLMEEGVNNTEHPAEVDYYKHQ